MPPEIEEKLYKADKLARATGMGGLSPGEIRKYAKMLLAQAAVQFDPERQRRAVEMGEDGGQPTNPMMMNDTPLEASMGPEFQAPGGGYFNSEPVNRGFLGEATV